MGADWSLSSWQPEVKTSISLFMAYVHTTVNEMSKTYLATERRYNYTTPKTFLEQIKLYQNLLAKKRMELVAKIERLENGLMKLQSTASQVGPSPWRARGAAAAQQVAAASLPMLGMSGASHRLPRGLSGSLPAWMAPGAPQPSPLGPIFNTLSANPTAPQVTLYTFGP